MSITLIIGPMFSGKTSELIRLVDRKRIADKKCLIIKHLKDTRYDTPNTITCITTHMELKYSACDIIHVNNFGTNIDLETSIQNRYEVVAIEEGHFYSGLNDFCIKLANHGIDVIVSALDSNFKQDLFLEIGKLIANAETVIKLDAICMVCKNCDASFTIRTTNSTELIVVGGTETYKSVCRNCLNSFKNSKTQNQN